MSATPEFDRRATTDDFWTRILDRVDRQLGWSGAARIEHVPYWFPIWSVLTGTAILVAFLRADADRLFAYLEWIFGGGDGYITRSAAVLAAAFMFALPAIHAFVMDLLSTGQKGYRGVLRRFIERRRDAAAGPYGRSTKVRTNDERRIRHGCHFLFGAVAIGFQSGILAITAALSRPLVPFVSAAVPFLTALELILLSWSFLVFAHLAIEGSRVAENIRRWIEDPADRSTWIIGIVLGVLFGLSFFGFGSRPRTHDLPLLVVTAWLTVGILVPIALHIRAAVRLTDNNAKKEPSRPPIDLLDWSLIPAGSFVMGSPENEEGRQNDEPQHDVELDAFYMSKTVVTRAQFRRVMKTVPSEWAEDTSNERLPANHTDWWTAARFCNELSLADGREPVYDFQDDSTRPEVKINTDADGYRLPTESEWEYACRAGTTTRFWSGETDDDLGKIGWYRGNSSGVQPVAEKKANPFELFDMHGNVWEWCQDWYGPYPGAPTRNRLGPAGGSGRVMRGGCYWDVAAGCRSAQRGWFGPAWSDVVFGFRVALPLPLR